MHQFASFALVLALVPKLLAGSTLQKCSPQDRRSDHSSIYICELLSKPERYSNRLVRVRARYVGGEIDTSATLFGDECLSKQVVVADPRDPDFPSMPEILRHGDSADQERNRSEFYSLGMEMCGHGRDVGYIPVEGTFTGVLMVKKGFRVGKDGTGNGFGFRGRVRMIFVLHSVTDTCRVNDCPSPWP